MDCVHECFFTGSLSGMRLQRAHELRVWQAYCYQVFFSDESSFSFGDMIAAFVLDAMPVNAVLKRALSNDIVAEHLESWSRVQFFIMDDQICYELRVIIIATVTP